MEGSRTLAEDTPKQKLKIYLDYRQFDFAKKMKVGEKGIMTFSGAISDERLTDKGDIAKTLKLSKIKLHKNPRVRK